MNIFERNPECWENDLFIRVRHSPFESQVKYNVSWDAEINLKMYIRKAKAYHVYIKKLQIVDKYVEIRNEILNISP